MSVCKITNLSRWSAVSAASRRLDSLMYSYNDTTQHLESRAIVANHRPSRPR